MILEGDLIVPYLDGRVYKEATSLKKNQTDVVILCIVDSKYNKELSNNLNYNGITIKRIFKKNLSFRKYLIIALYFRIKYLVESIILGLSCKYDIIHCHDLQTLFIGVILRIISNRPVIYDSHELYTKTAYPKLIIFRLIIYEKILLLFINSLIVASDSRKKVMQQLYPLTLKKKRIVVINNYPPKSNKKSLFDRDKTRNKNKFNNKVIFLYQGVMSEGRGIDNIIKSVSYLKNTKGLIILLVGGTHEQHQKLNKLININSPCIRLLSPVTHEKLQELIAACDVGIVSYINTCLNNYYCAPNKLYEYLQNGLAILGVNFPDVESIIHEYNVGVTCNFTDPIDIAKKIDWFIENKETLLEMKNCANLIPKELFSWESEEIKLINLYKSV
jgi:glycosyltransferase involved in cell wall biosynthesis